MAEMIDRLIWPPMFTRDPYGQMLQQKFKDVEQLIKAQPTMTPGQFFAQYNKLSQDISNASRNYFAKHIAQEDKAPGRDQQAPVGHVNPIPPSAQQPPSTRRRKLPVPPGTPMYASTPVGMTGISSSRLMGARPRTLDSGLASFTPNTPSTVIRSSGSSRTMRDSQSDYTDLASGTREVVGKKSKMSRKSTFS